MTEKMIGRYECEEVDPKKRDFLGYDPRRSDYIKVSVPVDAVSITLAVINNPDDSGRASMSAAEKGVTACIRQAAWVAGKEISRYSHKTT